jgi:hypothetical protein
MGEFGMVKSGSIRAVDEPLEQLELVHSELNR